MADKIDFMLLLEKYEDGTLDPTKYIQLGNIYESGILIEKSIEKAKEIYLKAISLNQVDAYFYYGNLLEEDEKLNNYKKGASLNSGICLWKLACISKLDENVVDRKKIVLEYINKSIDNKYPYAYYELGRIYEQGLIVKQDLGIAKEYYEIAEALNVVDAKIRLIRMNENKDPQMAFNEYNKIKNTNNFLAYYYLGRSYEFGIGVGKNIELAIKNYLYASENKIPEAMSALGYLFYEEGKHKNLEEAFRYYEDAFNMGEHNLATALAYRARYGEGIKKNLDKMIYFLVKGSKFEVPMAFNMLADCYQNEIGVKKDLDLAIYYHEQAIKHDYIQSYSNLGYLYETEYLVRNLDKAFYYYSKGSTMNDSSSMFYLGVCYEDGKGVKRDFLKALEWYETAYEKGNGFAAIKLGEIYEDGTGVKKDYKKAFEYYEEAANQGYYKAEYYIELMYLNGNYVNQDIEKAIGIFKKLTNNYFQAAIYLGYIYRTGYYVEKNDKESFNYYKIAAKTNNPRALYNLAFSYLNGVGTKKDKQKYYELIVTSADGGYSDAMVELGLIYEYGQMGTVDKELALSWYEKAMNIDDEVGTCNVAYCYHKGIGTEADFTKAIKYYEKAIELGSNRANYCLAEMYRDGEGGRS